MQWEIAVAVIILIGILAAIKGALEKRAARKNESKATRTLQEASKKPDK